MDQPTKRSSRWKGTGVALLALLLLSACARPADFGRTREGTFDRLKAAVMDGEGPGTRLALTGAELDLRGMAQNLAGERPAREDDHLWGLSYWIADRREAATPRSLRYYERLRALHSASPSSLLNALVDDIEADTARMDRLAAVAAQVIDADGERANALLGHDGAGTTSGGAEIAAQARDRLDENGRIIDRMADILASRLVGYRAALAEARIDAPLPDGLARAASAIDGMQKSMATVDDIAVRHETLAGLVRKQKAG